MFYKSYLHVNSWLGRAKLMCFHPMPNRLHAISDSELTPCLRNCTMRLAHKHPPPPKGAGSFPRDCIKPLLLAHKDHGYACFPPCLAYKHLAGQASLLLQPLSCKLPRLRKCMLQLTCMLLRLLKCMLLQLLTCMLLQLLRCKLPRLLTCMHATAAQMHAAVDCAPADSVRAAVNCTPAPLPH